MYQSAARIFRPVATTVAAGGAGAAAGASGASVAHSEALRPVAPGPAREIRIEEIGEAGLTVFAGKELPAPGVTTVGAPVVSHPSDVWSFVDSCGEVSEEEVRSVLGPMTGYTRSSSDSGSEGFEAESVMHQTEGIIKNIYSMVNDPEIRQSLSNHPAMADLVSSFQQNPQLLPPSVLALPAPSTVTIEEVQVGGEPSNPLKLIGDALSFIGNQIGEVCNKTGNFFKGVAGRISGKGSKDEGGDGDAIFTAVFALIIFALFAVVAKRAGR